MKTVLLLGAGASVAHAAARKVDKEHQPPVDKNLFERARELRIKQFDSVADFVQTRFGLDIAQKEYSAEHVFNLLHQHALDKAHEDSEAEMAYSKLRRLYLDTIAECTNKLDGKVETGLSGLFQRLLDEVEPGDLWIVDFNYDLISEKTLVAFSEWLNDQHQLFSLQASYYPMDFGNRWFPGDGSDDFFTPMLPEVVRILKPHGSMNWFLGYEKPDDADRLRPVDPGQTWCCEAKAIRTDFDITVVEVDGSKQTRYLRPLIVPPVFDKGKYWGDLLAPVWTEFQKALSEADRLVVCGYSLPDADVKAQTVIAGALAANKRLKRVDIIDVNPAVCNRFVQKTCIHSVTYHDSISSFLDHDF